MSANTYPPSDPPTTKIWLYDITRANQFRHDDKPAHDGYALLAVDERDRPLTCVVLGPAIAAKKNGRYLKILTHYQEMILLRPEKSLIEATHYLFTLGGTKKVFIGLRNQEQGYIGFDAFLEVIEIDPDYEQAVLTKLDWRPDWVLVRTVLYHNPTKLGFEDDGNDAIPNTFAIKVWRDIQEEMGNSPLDYAMEYYLAKRQAARLFSELRQLDTLEQMHQLLRGYGTKSQPE